MKLASCWQNSTFRTPPGRATGWPWSSPTGAGWHMPPHAPSYSWPGSFRSQGRLAREHDLIQEAMEAAISFGNARHEEYALRPLIALCRRLRAWNPNGRAGRPRQVGSPLQKTGVRRPRLEPRGRVAAGGGALHCPGGYGKGDTGSFARSRIRCEGVPSEHTICIFSRTGARRFWMPAMRTPLSPIWRGPEFMPGNKVYLVWGVWPLLQARALVECGRLDLVPGPSRGVSRFSRSRGSGLCRALDGP